MSARRVIESSDDDAPLVPRMYQQESSPERHRWSVDDPREALESETHLVPGPPTSSSGGRLSDGEIEDLDASVVPHSPLSLSARQQLQLLGRAWPSGDVHLPPSIQSTQTEAPAESSNPPGDGASRDEQEQDQSDSGEEMDSQSRRRWRAAKRMMPMAMLLKQAGQQSPSARTQRPKPVDGAPVVGRVLTKVSTTSRNSPMAIRGDSESSSSEDHKGPVPRHDRDRATSAEPGTRSFSVISISSAEISDDSEAPISVFWTSV